MTGPDLVVSVREYVDRDFESVYSVINDAAVTFRGVIPDDRWHEPYMPRDELEQELADGVRFSCAELAGNLVGVMGFQSKGDVDLIRHAYVKTDLRGRGIGAVLLGHLEARSERPILLGTWAVATWAIAFYEKHGYRLVAPEDRDRLLREYWSIPERQIEESIVMADARWVALHAVEGH